MHGGEKSEDFCGQILAFGHCRLFTMLRAK